MIDKFKALFLLDRTVTFLNHGSFGACPRTVLERCQEWQREVERQPVEFFARRAQSLLSGARAALGAFLGVDHSDVVFITNATVGINIVAHSLGLKEGDEVLATDHEYGAVDRTWRFWGKERGFVYKQVAIPLGTDDDESVEIIFKNVTKKTKVISISHISSPTATIFPVAKILLRAREMGVVTVVDGAHAPGQIELDLGEIGPDFYVGNLHKWVCAPKGAAFLYVAKQLQHSVKPLIVSWGYEAIEPSSNQFLDYTEYIGTRDLAPFLTVPTAIDFLNQNHWPAVRQECHDMLRAAEKSVLEITGQDSIYSSSKRFAQMAAMQLPEGTDPNLLKEILWSQFKIEIPVFLWNNRPFIRCSIQAYNSEQDVNALLNALKKVLK
jgi:isopenicillin-N epimerase